MSEGERYNMEMPNWEQFSKKKTEIQTGAGDMAWILSILPRGTLMRKFKVIGPYRLLRNTSVRPN